MRLCRLNAYSWAKDRATRFLPRRALILYHKNANLSIPLLNIFRAPHPGQPAPPRSLPVRVDLQRRGTARTAHTMPNCAALFTARHAHVFDALARWRQQNEHFVQLPLRRSEVDRARYREGALLPRSRSLSRASTEQNGHFVQLCISRLRVLAYSCRAGARAVPG